MQAAWRQALFGGFAPPAARQTTAVFFMVYGFARASVSTFRKMSTKPGTLSTMSGRLSTCSVKRLSTTSGNKQKTVNRNQEKTCRSYAVTQLHNALRYYAITQLHLRSTIFLFQSVYILYYYIYYNIYNNIEISLSQMSQRIIT